MRPQLPRPLSLRLRLVGRRPLLRHHREGFAAVVGYGSAHPVALGREPAVEQDIALAGGDSHVDAVAGQGDLAQDNGRGPRRASAIRHSRRRRSRSTEARNWAFPGHRSGNPNGREGSGPRRPPSGSRAAVHGDRRYGLCSAQGRLCGSGGAAKAAARASVIKRFIFSLHVGQVLGRGSHRRRSPVLCLRRLDKPGFRQ